MAEQRIVMTKKNYESLKQELEYLVKVKRPEIIERIAEARSHGDLSENAEYDAAREEQRSNEGKIAEIEYKIKNADIREEDTSKGYVHLGSVVTVYDEDMEERRIYNRVHNRGGRNGGQNFGGIARRRGAFAQEGGRFRQGGMPRGRVYA